MGSNFRRFPQVVNGLLALTGTRLLELAKHTQVSLKGLPKAPGAIAGALRDQLEPPSVLSAHLTASDIDAIGKRLGVGTRSSWKRNQATSFDQAVLERLFEQHQPPAEPSRRLSSRDTAGASQWNELATIIRWSKLGDAKRAEVAQALARAMGTHFKWIDFVGPYQLARIQDKKLGLDFVVIPGGRFTMGLGATEKQSLARLTKNWSEEARMHVQELAEIAQPAHSVKISPFLCARMPITRAQERKYIQGAQLAEAKHQVCLFEASTVSALYKKTNTRLLTEAEWEYVARAGGTRAWLAGDLKPKAYAEQVLASPLEEDEQPFGICGLGWGTWVEDGWHASYQGAPCDGSAWEPREIPQVVRSGALLSYPWQIDGEALLLHTTHRERPPSQSFPLLLARDLPANR
jgi:formylglycine-generating enzyme required for sulfatase activity